jgi:hypothetical protein
MAGALNETFDTSSILKLNSTYNADSTSGDVSSSDYGSAIEISDESIQEISDDSYTDLDDSPAYMNTLERILAEITYNSIYDTVHPGFSSQIFMRSMLEKYKTE